MGRFDSIDRRNGPDARDALREPKRPMSDKRNVDDRSNVFRNVNQGLLCLFVGAMLTAFGCGMSDDELRKRTGDAAVSVKQAAENASEKMKGAYDDAAAKGKEAMKDAQGTLSDTALKAKVHAGFGLVAGLKAENVEVEVREGKVYLSGRVPTALDKMKAEGVAYGVTGDRAKFESTIEVKE